MWKLIGIYIHKYQIIDCNEQDARTNFASYEHSPTILFAFLYNPKGNLEETYIGKQRFDMKK